MSKVWQLQEAKNRFSELVKEAQRCGPQVVTKHGKEAVVVLTIEDYQKLQRPKEPLAVFFQHSPLSEGELDLERSKDLPRPVDL